MSRIVVLLGLALSWRVAPVGAQDFEPPPPFPPSAEVVKQIEEKTAKLGQIVAALKKQNVGDQVLADVEIYQRAGAMMLQHREFFTKDSGNMTLNVLDRGLVRAKLASAGENPWVHNIGQTTMRGYRSRIDGTVQPFAVTLPAEYGKDPRRRWRVDIVLHGRNKTLTEAGFIASHSDKTAPSDHAHFVRIDVFGRGNNAYRWAGETDVMEATDAFFAAERLAGRGSLPDANRVVLRGFSMGGAGTWHLGLHYPDKWAAMGPGAGFTTTHGYVAKLPKLPHHQEACLRIYDAVDYAENGANIPVIAYSGEKDPQKKAADNMEERMKALGVPMTHVVAPGLEHQFPPAWFLKVDPLYNKHAQAGRPEYPDKVRFVTYTMKYSACAWVTLLGLDRHYEEARVEAERTDKGFRVKTKNVQLLRLSLPDGVSQAQDVEIDGDTLSVKPSLNSLGMYSIYLQRKEHWKSVLPQRILTMRQGSLRKIAGMTGPIEDAFADSFVCVRGTGKPWNAAVQAYADARLERFQFEWSKYFRGTLPIKNDVDIATEDIVDKNLILFGDPGSNSLIPHVLDGLPLTWSNQQVSLGKITGQSADSVPVLIYPNPLNPNRYVVLNSGMTIPTEDYTKTNAMLFPRLGDFAVLRLTGANALAHNIVAAGLFDDHWSMTLPPWTPTKSPPE